MFCTFFRTSQISFGYDIDKESELFSNSKSSGCVHPFLLKPFPLVETFIWCETWRPLKLKNNQSLDHLHLTTEHSN